MEDQLVELNERLARMEARQARLEDEHRAGLASLRRRMRATVGAATLVMVTGLAMGLARPGESQPRPEARRVRAPFTVEDSRGRPIFQVRADAATTRVNVLDRNGQPIAQVVDEPGARGFDIRDSAGKKIMGTGTLAVTGGELRGLDIYDGQERHLISLDVGSTSPNHGVRVLNPAGRNVANLVADPAANGRVILTDPQGSVTFQAPP